MKARFIRSESEATLYVKKLGDEKQLVVSLYVDDMLVIEDNEVSIEQFKQRMKNTFDLGDMKYFLGMEIHQSDADNFEKVDAFDYKSLIGNLSYLSATRPYIMYVASLLSRFIGAFAWNSKKQDVVAQSSAEVEYVSIATATNQAIWLKKILADLEQNTNEAITIWVDNKFAITITKNPVQHGGTKHINDKFHAIKEAERLGEISLKIKL
ncbi:uncharacterized protein [Gossypium hirsutum]|uniref:Reverse transcriptase Ty1/copia-type domain-containing protein n=1 Tax=Gossypium hirsutum TaxID=3635 RepID=A0A1U8KU67_GOSHI|nr:uncharacterized protein LOC107919290 [Gossypium hirsutum]